MLIGGAPTPIRANRQQADRHLPRPHFSRRRPKRHGESFSSPCLCASVVSTRVRDAGARARAEPQTTRLERNFAGRAQFAPSSCETLPVVAGTARRVKPARPPADTFSMIDSALDLVRENAEWVAVLEAYQVAQAAEKAGSAEHDGWIPRILEVEGILKAHLPPIHGKLIAHGFLKFQLNGRGAGVLYQLSPLGKRALGGMPGESGDDCDVAEMDDAAEAA